ncbi:MAG TPA: hypothetical protein VN743_12175 [Blastocatellia bacterium]|nr:hypothetical protein [Blastocatellia bacterium]
MAIRTIIFSSRIKQGSQQQLTHDLPIEFPAAALSAITEIKRVSICQGNGQFMAVVEYEGDFEKVFKQYLSSPSVQSFHFKIQRFFEDPPQSADPSNLNLAGDVFVWDGQQFNTATG